MNTRRRKTGRAFSSLTARGGGLPKDLMFMAGVARLHLPCYRKHRLNAFGAVALAVDQHPHSFLQSCHASVRLNNLSSGGAVDPVGSSGDVENAAADLEEFTI